MTRPQHRRSLQRTSVAATQRRSVVDMLEPRRHLAVVKLLASTSNVTEGSGQSLRSYVVRDALSPTSAPLTVSLSYAGTAVAGVDYLAGPSSVTIPAGARQALLSLAPINDSTFRPVRTVLLSVAPGSGYTLAETSTRTNQLVIRDDELPTGGTSAINAPSANSFGFFGASATRTVVTVTGQSFASANRITVSAAPTNIYDIQLSTSNSVAIAQGDVLLLRFFARATTSSGSGQFAAVVERNGGDYAKSLYNLVKVSGSTWQQFNLPFKAAHAFGLAGGTDLPASVTFQLGTQPMTIEIGGVSLTRFPATTVVNDLPRSTETYGGRDSMDLAWRDAAEARIEQIRKGNINLSVVDTSGNPVPNATVRLEQTQHGFGFGTAVTYNGIFAASSSDRTAYRSAVQNYFNGRLVHEWEIKWPAWQQNKQLSLNMLNWANSAGLDQFRGHNLLWPSWDLIAASPGSNYVGINYRADPNKPDAQEEWEAHVAVDGLAAARTWLRGRISAQLTDVLDEPLVNGKMLEWDVVNEAVYNNDLQNALGNGNGALVEWFNLARTLDPAAKLYLNDYPPMDRGTHLDAYFAQLSDLKSRGAAIDGIGFQSHFESRTPDMADVQATFDRFAALGLRMQITEFDSTQTDEQLRADFMRDYALLSFSQPAVDGFLHWGFWTNLHWIPEAALFNSDWSPRWHGQTWIDLMSSTWRTDQTKTTDAAGQISSRGFFGDYRYTVTVNGQSTSFTRQLSPGQTGTTQLVIADTVAPRVTATSDSVDTSYRATFDFSENVLASLSVSDIAVTNLTTNTGVPASGWTMQSTNINGKTRLIVRLNGVPADGDYRITVNAAGVADPSGNVMVSSASRSFHVMAGDANRNRVVNFDDLLIVASNYNASPREFTQGDFDFSGRVDFSDLLVLAARYNFVLPGSAAPVSVADPEDTGPSLAADVLG